MLQLNGLADVGTAPDDTLTLPFQTRQKSRFSAVTDDGKEVGVFLLLRGECLRSGMVLTSQEGIKVRVQAAPEPLSVVRSDDALLMARACYHLGNRHISLQILEGELRYLADHVLDHMIEGLGLAVEHRALPFEPEAGAYHGHGH
jgi:urease accessory protein